MYVSLVVRFALLTNATFMIAFMTDSATKRELGSGAL